MDRFLHTFTFLGATDQDAIVTPTIQTFLKTICFPYQIYIISQLKSYCIWSLLY